MLLVVLLLCCLSATANCAAASSCASCTDLTAVSGANGTDVVLATLRLLDDSDLFGDDYQTLRRIAHVETRDGALEASGGDGIWAVNETGFASLVGVNATGIRAYFGIEWSSVTYSDLSIPLYSGLAARLLIDQLASGYDLSNTSSQAMLWADSYGGIAEQYINDTEGLTNYRENNIYSLEFGTYFKSTITTTTYFQVMASNATSILQLVLSVNENTQLYVSNLIEPSAAFHCSRVETNSTANLLLNASQLYKNEDERNVLYISIEVVQATEISLGVSVIELDKGTDPIDTYAEEFFIGLFDNHPDSEYTPLLVSVTTRETSPFTVTVESQAGVVTTETINPTDIMSIVLPSTYLVSNNSERYKGVVVKAESGRTISVSVGNYDQFSSDSYLALPLYQYSGVTEYVYYAITPETDSSLLQNRVLLVGGYNSTNITIIPKETVYIPSDLSPTGEEYELSSNESLTIQLNRFQTLLLESEMSLSGSKFITSKPVAFLSGHQCALIPSDATNRSCDITIEQLPPTLNWGKTFIFPLLSSQTGGAFVTILAAENNTQATLHCASISTDANTTDVSYLNTTGDFITYLISPDDLVCSIVSDSPVLVTLEASSEGSDDSDGDPFMMLVPPAKQYSNATHYFAPFNDNFTSNYINIALIGQPNDVLLDDASITDVPSVYGTDGSLLGYALQLNTSTDNRTLSVAYGSNTIYTAWIYGFDFAVSYGQSLGMNLLLTGDDSELTVTIESQTYSGVGMIQIICSTTGPPVYITHWYKGGDLIYPSCKHTITSSSTTVSILTISSVSTDDIGQYTCTPRSYYTSRSATAVTYITLQAPFPLLSLSTDPSNYSQLVSATSPLFTCSAVIDYTIFNPDELAVVFVWLRNSASISIDNSAYNITNSTLSSTLNILSLGTQDNNAVYSCAVYVNPVSSSPYLMNNSASTQITLQVQAFSSGHVSFSMTKLPSVPTSGGTVNISCQINVPERLYVVPSFVRLAYNMNGSNAVDSSQGYTEENLVYFTEVTLSNINTSDATTYYCVIAFSALSVTAHAFTNLSMNLATSMLDIIPSHSDLIYESSRFSLTCEVTLPSSVDTPVSFSYVWRNPYGSVIHWDDRIYFYNGPSNQTLIFNPIDNGDSNSMQTDAGQYTCRVYITPDNVNVNSANYITTSDSLVIEDLPELILEITYSLDAPEEGDSLNITCSVTYPGSLIIVPTVSWSLPISESIPETRTTSLNESVINVTLSLDPVLYDYNGVYSCVAEYNVTSYSLDYAKNSTEYELDVPLIIPNVSITGYPTYDGAFAAGTNVHLLCRVDLDFETKSLVITWSLSNVTLANDSTYIVGPVQRTPDYYYGILTINSISLDDDEDTYTCMSLIYHSNQDTIATNCENFNLSVSDRPIVTLYPMELTVGYGNEARFECQYSSDLSSNVLWFKDGQRLSHETHNIYINDTHSVLTITSTTTADNGTYSCSVSNSIGTSQENSVLLIGVLTVNISPLPVTILEHSDTVNVTCLASNNLKINDMTYTWLLDDRVIDVNKSFIVITYMSSDQVDDSGEYRCRVSSLALSLTIESQRTLVVLAPVIVANPLPAVETLANNSIQLICNATGYPLPSIEWRRISVENSLTTLQGIDNVTVNLPYNITNESSIDMNEVSSVLTLQSVDYEDFGYYVCIATLTPDDVYALFDNSNVTLMDYHAISSTATLTVSPYGSVQVNPSFTIANYGDTVVFNCTSRGGPNNQYTWYRLSESGDITVGLMSQLEIEINSIELTARYYCNVTNDAGSSSVYTYLDGILSVSIFPSTATVLTLGDSITLSCVVNHNISNPDDLSYAWYYNYDFHVVTSRRSSLTLNYSDYSSVSQGGNYNCGPFTDYLYILSFGFSLAAPVLFSPLFTVQPVSVEARYNDSVELSCTAFGYPVPVIEWKRVNSLNTSDFINNIIELPESAYNDTVAGTNNITSTLIIDDIQYDDFGYYLCVATMSSSELSEDVQVLSSISTVTVSPEGSVNISSNGTDTKIGDTVRLVCSSRGGPNNQYSWTHHSSNEAIGDEPELILVINSVGQFGEYKCSVSNEAGTDNNTSIINGILAVNLIPTSAVVSLEYGDSYNLTCTTFSVSSLSVQISWYKDDVIINNTVTQILTIDYMSPESVDNGGSYKCVTQGTVGSSIGESNSVLIIFSPHIVQRPSNVLTRVNRQIQFMCNATGYPLPSIEWRRISVENNLTTLQGIDNVTVNLPHRVTNESSIDMNEVSSVLTLQSVDYEDFGYYVCIATLTSDDVYVLFDNSNVTLMDYHAISSTATLTVSPSGSVQVNPPSILAYYGDTVVFNCTSRGGPNNQYTWYIDNHSYIIGRSDQLTLELNSVGLFSYYDCRVSNDAGSSDVSYLEVRGLLSVSIDPSNTSVISFGESLTLSCVVNHNTSNIIGLSYEWPLSNTPVGNNSFITLNYSDYSLVSQGGLYRCSAYFYDYHSYYMYFTGLRGYSNRVSVLFSPSFSEQPDSVTSKVNDSVELSCTAFGYPVPVIEWKRVNSLNTSDFINNIIELPENSYNDTVAGTNNITSTLIIDDIQYNDFGYYLCVATMSSSELSEDIQVLSSISTVTVSPEGSVNISSNGTDTKIGDTVRLVCSSRGGPNNQYSWTHYSSNEIIGDEPELILAINSVDHFGEYRCSVSNEAGTDNNTSIVNGILSVNLIPTSVVVSLEYGDSYNLTCTINGYSMNTTSVQISWYNGDKLLNDTETQILTIDYMSPESVDNGGSYKCLAQGTEGSSIGESNSVLIIFSPHIVQRPSNILTHVNRQIQFICNATGYPLPSIEWRRISVENSLATLQGIDNVTVNLPYNVTNESSINMNEVSSVLTLQSVDYNDFGYYVCIATLTSDDVYVLFDNSNVTLMDYHAISSTATLTVSPYGSVQVNPSSILAYYGDTVVFNCSSRGGPNNQYTWHMYRFFYNYNTIGRSDQLTLELNSVSLFSSYDCRVSNDAGSDSVRYIEVRGLLSVSIDPSNTSVISFGESLTLSCVVNHNISNTTGLSYEWPLSSTPVGNNSFITLNYSDYSLVSQGGLYRCSAYYYNYFQYSWYFTDLRGYSNRVSVLFSPSFSEQPDSVISEVNDSVELSCTAFGYPVPVIEWKRVNSLNTSDFINNIIELPESAYNDTVAGTNNITSTLIIDDIQYDDFGYYLCVATMSSSELSEDIQVLSSISTVTVSPEGSVNISSNGTDTKIGDTVRLVCSSRGGPNNQYSWTHYSSNETIGDEPELIIAINSVDQFGEYKCSVSNEAGTDNSTSIVNGILSVNLIPTNALVSLEYGDSYNLTCSIDGYSMNTSSVQISWYKDNVIINNNTMTQILTLNYTSPESVDNGGSYKCLAQGTEGSSIGGSNSVLIIFSPHIVQRPSNILTVVNRQIQFICNATGYPLPSIEWRRISVENNLTTLQGIDNVTVNLSHRVTNESSINMNEVSSVLTLQSVDYEDFGYYVCIATLTSDDVYVLFDNSNVTLMDYHAISSTATLTVSPSGSVQVNPPIIIAYYGDTVVFNCTSRGGPNNQYTWVMESIFGGSNTIGRSDQLTLELNSVGFFTNYLCGVSNDAGSDSVRYIEVRGLLSVSIDPSNTSVISFGESLTLSCVVNHNISNIIGLSYEWPLSNTPVGNNSFITLNYSDYSLVSQGGLYRCFAYIYNYFYNYWYFTGFHGYSNRVSVLFSPSFSEQPDSVTSKVKDSVELSCTAFGYPVPVIEWKRVNSLNTSDFINNIIELPESAYNDTVAGTNNITSTLIIDDIQYDDFGYYLCVATMSSSELSEDVQVLSSISTVTVSPEGSVNISSNGTDTKIGDTVRLVCSSRGGPNNQYSWTHYSSNEIIGDEPELILAINSVDQFGEYKCSVSNEAGTDNSTSIVNGILSVNLIPTNAIVSLEYGDSYNLTCSIDGYSMNTSSVQISWYKDNVIINNTMTQILTIDYTSPESVDNGGSYKCLAQGTEGSSIGESNSVLIIFSPHIVQRPSNILTVVDHQIQFICNATGYPLPSIEWRRISVENNLTTLQGIDNVTINLPYNTTNESSIDMNEVSSVLTLQSVDYEDFGYYVCIATLTSDDVYVLFDNSNVTLMDYHAISSTATLTVSPYRSVQVNPLFAIAYYGDTVVFNCTSRGGPNNQYTWHRYGILGDYNTIGRSDQLTLELNSIYLFTYYECRVGNDAGSSSMYNTLIGLLSVSIDPSNTSVISFGESLTLSCVINHNTSNIIGLSYEWPLSNTPVGNNSFITLNYSDYSLVSQGGLYRCSAYYYNYFDHFYLYGYFTDLRGYSNRVSVLFSPSFSEQPDSVMSRVNDSVELSCTAFGYPVPVIEWKRVNSLNTSDFINNIIELPESAYNDTVAGTNNITSTLIIDDIQYDDFGYYLCVSRLPVSEDNVSMPHLLSNISSVATVTISPEGSVVLSSYQINAFIHQNITINCSSSGGPDNTYQWQRYTDQGSGTIISNSSDLIISNVTVNDGGMYTCTVENEAGEENSTMQLNIGPTFNIHPVNTNVSKNSDLVLICTASGIPLPIISWTFNSSFESEATLSTSESIISYGTIQSQLYIDDIELFDSGNYQCQASIPEYSPILSNIASISVIVSPILVSGIENSTKNLTDTMIFTCTFSGFPKPDIIWYRYRSDGGMADTLTITPGEVNISTNAVTAADGQYTVESHLSLYDLEKSDEGFYECYVVDYFFGSDNSSLAYLTVQVPPNITSNDSIVTVSEGHTAMLTIIISDASPAVSSEQVEWIFTSFNGSTRVIELGGRYNFTQDRTGLILSNVGRMDRGHYTVIINHPTGIHSFMLQLFVTVAPEFVTYPISTVVNVTSVAQLSCSVRSHPATWSIDWYFLNSSYYQIYNSTAINITYSHTIDSTDGTSIVLSTLTINNVNITDDGIYMCRISSTLGANATITVQTPPIVTRGPSPIVGVVGSNVTLQFNITGDIPPVNSSDIYWFINGSSLRVNERFMFSTDRLSLTITDLSFHDEGSYHLTASNPAGTSNNSIYVDIQVPPIIYSSSSGVYKRLNGTTIYFYCRARGLPTPVISWFFNEDINITQNVYYYSYYYDDSYSRLTVTNITLQDAGLYTCIASNVHGTDNATATLQVQVPPTLIDDGLRNITTAAGDDVTLFCNATGYPPPTIVWFKNDVVLSEERELSADGVFITNFTHDVTSTASYLYIPGVDRSDNGLYHCQSYNDLARVITVTAMKVSLQILNPPSLLNAFNETIYNTSDTLVLYCIYSSFPAANITWHRVTVLSNTMMEIEVDNRTSIEFVSRNDILETSSGSGGSGIIVNLYDTASDLYNSYDASSVLPVSVSVLAIENLIYEDEGNYTCHANNSVANLIDSVVFNTAYITVQRAPLVLANLTSPVIGVNGSSITLIFTITEDNPPVVLDEIQWLFNGTVLSAGNRVSFSMDRRSVTITQLQVLLDEGIYTLIATNPAGTTSASIFLNVQVPPIVIESDGVVNVLEGANATFSCHIASEPTHITHWLYNDQLLASNEKHVITGNGTRYGTLTINGAQYTDQGEYTCIGTNVHGQINATGTLSVQVLPVLRLHPHNQNKVAGQNVTFRCTVTGNPPPSVNWTHSGGLDRGNNMIHITPGSATSLPIVESRYIIDALNLPDVGGYQCIVANTLVDDFTRNSNEARLTLNYPANVTVFPAVLVDKFDRTVTFTCQGFGIGTPTLTWYRNNSMIHTSEKLILTSRELDQSGYTVSELKLTISNTATEDEGTYECRGANNVTNLIGAIDTASGRFLIEAPPNVEAVDASIIGLRRKNVTLSFTILNAAPLVIREDISWNFTNTTQLQPDIVGDSHYVFSEDGLSLTILNLVSEDEGKYEITTTNRNGMDTAVIALTVDADPVITIAPTNMSVVSEKNITLACSATGKPHPVIMWSFNDNNITIGTKFNQSASGSLTARIDNITDEGTYQCTASNKHSSNMSSAFVSVQDPPHFMQNPSSLNGTASLSSNFTCTVMGHPIPVIYWFKNNTIIDIESLGSGIKYLIEPSEIDGYTRRSSLTIFDLEYDDNGIYHCFANNTLFENRMANSTGSTFGVHYPPDLISSFDDLIKNKSDTLTLHCQFSGTPAPSITWYRNISTFDAMLRTGGKISIREVKSFRKTNSSLEVRNLVKEDEGTYTCIGSNGIGNFIDAVNTSKAFITIYVPATIYRNEMEDRVVGVKDYDFDFGFVIELDFPPVKLDNIQWHFTNLSNVTVDLRNNATDTMHYDFSPDYQQLYITRVELSDRGYYTLTATNEAGVRNSTIYLDVHVQPKLLSETGVYLLVNTTESPETRVLNCSADGIPAPNILWRRNGQLVLNSTRVSIIVSPVLGSARNIRVSNIPDIKQVNSSITISNLRETDNGDYTCRADNSAGVADILNIPYQLNVTYLPPPKFCEVNRARLSEICFNGGTCVDLSGGRFECRCTERYTGQFCQEEVVIEIPPSTPRVEASIGLESKIYSLLPPYNATGIYFEPLNLTCYSSGNPQPTITWFKYEKVYYNLSRTIEFPELNLTNRGYYKCVAENSQGISKSEFFIVNVSGIAQYKMDINISNINDAVDLQDLINEISSEIAGGKLPGTNGTFVSVIQKTNTSEALKNKNLTVLVTILIDHSDSHTRALLQDYMNKLETDVRIDDSTIVRFDGCSASETVLPSPITSEDLSLTLQWPETNLGDTAIIECPCGGLDLNSSGLIATRRCGGDYDDGAVWEDPIDERCNFSIVTRKICRLAERPADEKVEELISLTNNTDNFETAEVTASVAVLVTATEDVAGNRSLTEDFLGVVNNLVSANQEVLMESNTEAKTSSKLLGSIEVLSEALPAEVGGEPVVITQTSFAISVQEVEVETFQGQTISANGVNLDFNNSETVTTKPAVSLELPRNLFQVSTGNSTRITNSVFLNDLLYLRRDTKNLNVSGIIISAGLAGIDRVYNLTNPTVNLEFQRNISGRNPLCTFWDRFLDEGFGDWSTDGCVVNETFGLNESRTLCHCNHLTSFSVLLDVSPEVGDTPPQRTIDKALSAVTYIGIIISIFCLVITIVSYGSNKKLRSSDHGQLLLHLCCSFIGMYSFFIFAIHSTAIPELCAIVAVILQYFFLVTFMLMAAEAINLYLKLVVVLGDTISHFVLKASTISWILPLFICLFCFAPGYYNYHKPHFCRAFDLPFYLGMIAPFVIIYIFNWSVFAIIFVSLLRKSCSKNLKETKETSKMIKAELKKQFFVAVTLSILLGLGWGIGLPATQSFIQAGAVRDVFAAFFVLLTAFQGLFIFIMHCLRSPDIRKVWAGWFKLATGKEVSDFSSSIIANKAKKNTDSYYGGKKKFNRNKNLSTTSDASSEFTYNQSTLQRYVRPEELNRMGTLERFGQGEGDLPLANIYEEEEENSLPVIKNIYNDDEESSSGELEYGLKTFQLPEGVLEGVFAYDFADSASVGGLTVASEDGRGCTVFENPMEMKLLDPFDQLSTSASHYSIASTDFLQDNSQTVFKNPMDDV